MSIDWGYTVPPDEAGGDIAHALAEANAPRHSDRTPREWIRANLFNNWYNSLITVVFGAIALYGGYRLAVFLFSGIDGKRRLVGTPLRRATRRCRTWLS